MVLNPRVAINVQNNITLTQPGAAVIALIGTAQWGDTASLQTFSNFAQVLDTYKGDNSSLSQGIIRSADVAYSNGAQTVKVVRITDGTEAAATKALAGNSGGTAGVLTFNGEFKGSYGNNILVTVTAQGTGRIVSITDGQTTETFNNNSDPNGYATNAAIASAINSASNLCTVVVLTGSETINLVDAASNQALTGGLDGAGSIVSSNYTTAFDNFLSNEDWDVLICPGTDALNASDAFHTTMLGKVNSRESSNKKYGIFVSGVAKDETVSTMQARTTRGSRLVLTAPSMTYTPSFQTTSIVLNGSYVGAALAGIIAQGNVQDSPTRKVIGISPVVLTTSGKQYYNLGEVEQILGFGIVPISLLEGAVKVARGVTRLADVTSIYFEINIVRIVDYVKGQVQQTLDPFLGQSNLERVRKGMAAACDGILQQDQLDEVIAAYQPTQVTTTVSPDTVNVQMTLQPTFAVNFINVTLAVSRLS